MNDALRLYYFDVLHGQRIGLKVLAKSLGWPGALRLAARLQWQLLVNHPFAKLNKEKPPTLREKLSQRQMAPLVILYRLLRQDGESETQTLALLQQVSEAVALAFLTFNIPIIEKIKFEALDFSKRESALKKITQRFFNAEAKLKVQGESQFDFTVTHCHFAHYCRLLDVPQIAPLFCNADRLYFEKSQPDVVFFRSRTLANEGLPCDFSFTWK